MKTAIAIIAAVLLVGCAPRDYSAQDHRSCVNLGTQPGEDAYVQCRLGIANLRQQRQANAWAAYGNMMQNYQRSLQMQQQRRSVYCYHTGYTTTCQ